MSTPAPNDGAAYALARNDELDVFELRDLRGAVVALIPVGRNAYELKRQEQVRDLMRGAPALIASAHLVLDRIEPVGLQRAAVDRLRQAVGIATGRQAE